MKFLEISSGCIFNVTNETLIPSYEASERFSKVIEEAEPTKEEAPKKATTKKK